MIKTTIFFGFFWFASLCGVQSSVAAIAKTKDLELAIGIIQRLGAEPIKEEDSKIERVTINSVAGDSLEVRFLDKSQSSKPIETKKSSFAS